MRHLSSPSIISYLLVLLLCSTIKAYGSISKLTMKKIEIINKKGPYLGIIAPNLFELNPLLQSPSFIPHRKLPYLDFAGRRFRMGSIGKEKVIIVMTGLGMVNSGTTTLLLLSLFEIKGVLHYGIAGNANPNLHIADVTIPRYWAHTGLWNWQRYGDGPEDELSLESFGDYTRTIGFLKFSDFDVNKNGNTSIKSDNLLNNIWFQPEEVFPVDGTPETRQHSFWVPVDKNYFNLSKQLEGMKLEECVNATTCLGRAAMVARVDRGISSSIFVDNAAYRGVLNSKFNATPIDMESAAVALVCQQQKMPFLVIRALSDLAGGGGDGPANEAATFATLASQNSVAVLIKFISLLS